MSSVAWTLRVQVENGDVFDVSHLPYNSIGGFFRCTFNGCINQTSVVSLPVSIGIDPPPVWNEALEWQFDDKTLKKLKRAGASIKLQLFIIPDWMPTSEMALPIEETGFQQFCDTLNVQSFGYVVLDLKNALWKGKQFPNIESSFLKLRNIKQLKSGINPQVSIAYWCVLQDAWTPTPGPEEKVAESESLLSNQELFKAADNIDASVAHSGEKAELQTWTCEVQRINSFVNLPSQRLTIVCRPAEYHCDLPLSQPIQFSHHNRVFSCALRTNVSTSNKQQPQWNTLAMATIHVEQVMNTGQQPCQIELKDKNQTTIAQLYLSIQYQSMIKDVSDSLAQLSLSQQTLPTRPRQVNASMQSNAHPLQSNLMSASISSQSATVTAPKQRMKKKPIRHTPLSLDISDSEPHKYRIAIDMRSIRDLTESYCIQCKYVHSFVGSNNKPFLTNPPTMIQRFEEKPIPNGFCAYEIVCPPTELLRELTKSHLQIQIIHKDIYSSDIDVGWCWIDLSDLLYLSLASNGHKLLRFIDEFYTIYDISASDLGAFPTDIQSVTIDQLRNLSFKAVGNLRVITSLEDFGICDAPLSSAPKVAVNAPTIHTTNSSGAQPTTPPVTGPIDAQNILQSTRLLQEQVLQELNRWKQEQQQKWQQRWKALETQRLQELEEQWKEQESSRAQLAQKHKSELTKLEKKLKTSLYDVESQERHIKMEQTRLEQRKEELETGYKLKQNEITHSLKRLRSDHKYENEALDRAISFLKKENELIQTKYENEQRRCEELREEMMRYKKQSEASTAGQLKMEITRLKQKLAQYESEMEMNGQRDSDLRLQLKSSLKEISRLNNEMSRKEKEFVETEKKKVEKLRVELMTRAQFKELRNDRSELQSIKTSLNRIMMQQQGTGTVANQENQNVENQP